MASKTPVVLYGKKIRPLQAGDTIVSNPDFTDTVVSKTADYTVLVADYFKKFIVPSSAAANVNFNLPTAASIAGKYFKFKNDSSKLVIVRAGITNKMAGASIVASSGLTNGSNAYDGNLTTAMTMAGTPSANFRFASAGKINLVRMYCKSANTPVLSGLAGQIQNNGGASPVVFIPGGTADVFSWAADKYVEWPVFGAGTSIQEVYFPTMPAGKAIYEIEAYGETINDEFPFLLVPQNNEIIIWSDGTSWRCDTAFNQMPEKRFVNILAASGGWADINWHNRTDLCFNLKGNVDYNVNMILQYVNNGYTAKGVAGSLYSASTPSALSYTVEMPLTATTTYINHQTAFNTGNASATSISTFTMQLRGIVRLPQDDVLYYSDKMGSGTNSMSLVSGLGEVTPVSMRK